MECSSVSVAMATYNGSLYIDEQLADIAAQSVPPSELVVCDDGSSDDTLLILQRFAATAPFPVRIHRNEDRLGYRANFLKCASHCRSDLIAFCDQDDRWLPGKIEAMRSCFKDREVLLAFHGADVISGDGKRTGRLPLSPRPVGATPPLGGSPWTFALGFTQIFRRWLCDFDRWWDRSRDQNTASEPLAHDQWYFFLASALGTIIHVDEPLVQYRQHAGNVYGWTGAGRKFATRVRGRIDAARSWSARCAIAATKRALILDEAFDTLADPYRERAREGSAAYRQLAKRCAQRADIYAGSTLRERARCFGSVLTGKGYGSDPWRFGPMALAMDLVVGIPGLHESRAGSPSKKAGLLL